MLPEQIILPAAKVNSGTTDNDRIIRWYLELKRQDVSISARIRRAILESMDREDETLASLKRIEAKLDTLLQSGCTDQVAPVVIDDPILDADL